MRQRRRRVASIDVAAVLDLAAYLLLVLCFSGRLEGVPGQRNHTVSATLPSEVDAVASANEVGHLTSPRVTAAGWWAS